MLDLAHLEQRLNTDAAFRAKFLADPVGSLRQEGIWLSTQQGIDLRQCVSRMQARPSAASFQGKLVKLGFWVEAANKLQIA
jgi:hypothetical protein